VLANSLETSKAELQSEPLCTQGSYSSFILLSPHNWLPKILPHHRRRLCPLTWTRESGSLAAWLSAFYFLLSGGPGPKRGSSVTPLLSCRPRGSWEMTPMSLGWTRRHDSHPIPPESNASEAMLPPFPLYVRRYVHMLVCWTFALFFRRRTDVEGFTAKWQVLSVLLVRVKVHWEKYKVHNRKKKIFYTPILWLY